MQAGAGMRGVKRVEVVKFYRVAGRELKVWRFLGDVLHSCAFCCIKRSISKVFLRGL